LRRHDITFMNMTMEKIVEKVWQPSATQAHRWDVLSAVRRTRTHSVRTIEHVGLGTEKSWTLSFTSPKRVLLLGTGKCADSLACHLSHRLRPEFELVGHVDKKSSPVGQICGENGVLGTYEELSDIVTKYRVTTVVVCVERQRGVLPFSTLLALKTSGVEIIEGPNFQETLQRQLPLFLMQPSQLVFEGKESNSILFFMIKRMIDVAGASILLFFLFPLFVILICILKLESCAPLFRRTLHEGRYGCSFGLLQFRVPGMNKPYASNWMRRNVQSFFDETGRVCVAWHLIQIPQLFHVLLGQMSFVGPRATTLRSTRQANEGFSYYRLRQTVRPGLTGWAQTKISEAMLSSVSQNELEYDLYYIRHLSCLFDLRIVLRTFRLLLPSFPNHF
ncbi:MAG: sugar transferase, partial [Nitrospirales bacterium]